MIVHYYEAAALCHPGHPPGQVPTLDDYHRTAWRLFAGEAHHPQQERPFLFRFDALEGGASPVHLEGCSASAWPARG